MAHAPPFQEAVPHRAHVRSSITHLSDTIRPPRTMNVDKCVEFHNKILEHGWVHSGKSKEDLEGHRKTWFDYHGDRAEAIRDILSPDITAFLERAYVVDCEGGHAFFYYVSGLFSPSLVHESSEPFNHDPLENGMLQNIVLYNMNSSFGSHPVGLV